MYQTFLFTRWFGIGAGVEQPLHEVEIAQLLVGVAARLRIAGARRPHQVDRGVERRDAVLGGEVRVGAAVEQHAGEIELAVHASRRAAPTRCRRPCAGSRRRRRRAAPCAAVDVALAHGVEQRRHPALPRDLLVEHVLALGARRQDLRRPPAAGARHREVAAVGVLAVPAERRQIGEPGGVIRIGAARDRAA